MTAKRINIYINEEALRALDLAAKRQLLSRSAYIADSILLRQQLEILAAQRQPDINKVLQLIRSVQGGVRWRVALQEFRRLPYKDLDG